MKTTSYQGEAGLLNLKQFLVEVQLGAGLNNAGSRYNADHTESFDVGHPSIFVEVIEAFVPYDQKLKI